MSEQGDTAELIRELRKFEQELVDTGAGRLVLSAARRLQELHDRLATIEAANADRSAITERYYQQAVDETRDYGND
jgi:soluble P-type ATPase